MAISSRDMITSRANRLGAADLLAVAVLLLLSIMVVAWVWYAFRPPAEPVAGKETTPGSQVVKEVTEVIEAEPRQQSLPGSAQVLASTGSQQDAQPPGSAATGSQVWDQSLDLNRIPERYHKQVQSVIEAARTGQYPERLTPNMPPKAFDKTAFLANPQAYLDVVEPGRVYQSLPGGKDIPATRPLVPFEQSALQGRPVPLQVVSAPNAPVTFTTFDGGHFENHLSSITVLSNAAGEAKAYYTATRGVVADVNIIAASPMASYQVQLRLIYPADSSQALASLGSETLAEDEP